MSESTPKQSKARPKRRRRGERVPHVRVRPERPVDPSPPDPERTLAALRRSLEIARGQDPTTSPVLVRPQDVQPLTARELRPDLDELLTSRHADSGLDSLLTTGVLECLLPEVDAMVGFGDGEWRHKDVWKHTKQVVIQARPTTELRWSALLHDIGKVRTRTIDPGGEVHFHGHAEVGARMFRKMERRLRLFEADETLREEIHFLVLHHLRASCYDGSWTDSAVRRFARDMGPYLEDLLALSRADMTTKRPEKKRRAMNRLHELAERIGRLAAEDAKVPPLPKGLGDALMKEFALPPSKRIGDIKRALEAACETGEIPEQKDSDYYVDFVARNRERFGLSG